MKTLITLQQALNVAKQGGPLCISCPASIRCHNDNRVWCREVIAACFEVLAGEIAEKERRVQFFKQAAKAAIG